MSRSRTDELTLWTLRGVGVLVGAVVLFLFAFLIVESIPALRVIGLGRLIGDPSWHPGEGTFGLSPMILGTLFASLGAIAIAAPLGVAGAVFCRTFAPPVVARVYRRLVELLAGIPSVVFGFWGLVTLVPRIAEIRAPGTSLLAGALILGLMILPTVALIADSSLAAVPAERVRGAAALGFGRWATMRRILLPEARSGILSGVFLAFARAIGETMAVMMVCGNVVQVPASLFEPVRTLTANIALEMAYAVGDHRAALFATGLVLGAMVCVLVIAGEFLRRTRLRV